jgi:hypothetical protein
VWEFRQRAAWSAVDQGRKRTSDRLQDRAKAIDRGEPAFAYRNGVQGKTARRCTGSPGWFTVPADWPLPCPDSSRRRGFGEIGPSGKSDNAPLDMVATNKGKPRFRLKMAV